MHWPGSLRRTRSLSHSLRARLARSHTRRELRDAHTPERRGKVDTALAPDFLRWEVHLTCLLSNLRNPVLAAGNLENAGHRDCPQPRQQ